MERPAEVSVGQLAVSSYAARGDPGWASVWRHSTNAAQPLLANADHDSVSDATPTFYEFFLIIICGAFAAAFLLSLLPLSGTVRQLLIAAGPAAAIVGLVIKSPQGLDAIGWAFLAGYGVLAWFVGLALGYLIHRLFRPDGAESLWSGFVRMVRLR